MKDKKTTYQVHDKRNPGTRTVISKRGTMDEDGNTSVPTATEIHICSKPKPYCLSTPSDLLYSRGGDTPLGTRVSLKVSVHPPAKHPIAKRGRVKKNYTLLSSRHTRRACSSSSSSSSGKRQNIDTRYLPHHQVFKNCKRTTAASNHPSTPLAPLHHHPPPPPLSHNHHRYRLHPRPNILSSPPPLQNHYKTLRWSIVVIRLRLCTWHVQKPVEHTLDTHSLNFFCQP